MLFIDSPFFIDTSVACLCIIEEPIFDQIPFFSPEIFISNGDFGMKKHFMLHKD
jgi:hypothetical protein